MSRRTLTMEEMELVNGGLIVDTQDGWFHVVGDNDGLVYNTSNVNKEYAMFAARMNGQSQEFISPAEYQKIFKRTFSPQN